MVTALVLAVALVVPAHVQAADQGYYWRWSDGSRQAARTFSQSDFGIASNLPSLVVTAEPALPIQTVYLQFLRDGVWTTESTARTRTNGTATIHVDPICGDSWCDGALSYRLRVGGQTARLTINYTAE